MFANPVHGTIRPLGSPKIVGNPVVTRDCAGHRATSQGCALDIGFARCGDPVIAAAAGTVLPFGPPIAGVTVGDAAQGIVKIDHGGGWRSVYAHMNGVLVKPGQFVTEGQQIGVVGDAHDPRVTNFAGCHLHFELVLNGVEQDPWPLLDQHQEDLMPGFKATGPAIGTFAMPPGQHALISPSDTRQRFPQPAGGTFSVFASLDLKTGAGVAIDIDGNSPPQNNRHQVYLVDAPNFGAAAYALRQDGTFTPMSAGHSDAELAAATRSAAHGAAVSVSEAAQAAAAQFPQ